MAGPSSIAPIGRAARTRQTLLDAGRALFAARAFDAVAIDDIVAQAGVAKGTFYNHFDDKDALLAAIVADIRAAIEARIGAMNEGITDPPVRIARAICVYVARAVDQPLEGQILLRNDPRGSASAPLNEGLRADLTAGLHSGRLLVPSIDTGLLFVIGIVHSLLLAAVRGRERAHMMLTAQQMCALMLRAFGLGHEEAALVASQAVDGILGDGILGDGISGDGLAGAAISVPTRSPA